MSYLFRKAAEKDIPFLADVVIAAEKSNSDKFSYSTIFNISDSEAKDLIVSMFMEEIDGCELSVSSYIVTEYENEPVAAFGSWIEGETDNIPSKILKSNLMAFTFGPDKMANITSKAEVLRGFYIEREKGALQLEYLYVKEAHRGKGLADELIKRHIVKGLLTFPDVKKVQVQTFANNLHAIKLYERNGFIIASRVKSVADKILDYLPHNEKVLMEKNLD